MQQQLLLGSTVSFPPGQTGCISGFFVVRPEAKKFIKRDECVPAERAGWFAETSYGVARSDAGFALVIGGAGGPFYRRLDSLTPVSEDEPIIFAEDE
jgi:hypothetical protein